jgi:hypothetical protein
MNNIVRDEIELTDAELAGIYGAATSDDGDEGTDTDLAPDTAPAPAPVIAPHAAPAPIVAPKKLISGDDHEEKRPCVDIFIICRKHQES